MFLYGGEALVNASRVVVHPDSISAFLGFDLALLRLASPPGKPTTLPLQPPEFRPEGGCWLSGWGRGFYFGGNAWSGGWRGADKFQTLPAVWVWVRPRWMVRESGIHGEEGSPLHSHRFPGQAGMWLRGFV